MTLLFPNRLKAFSRFMFYFSFLFGVVYLVFLEGDQKIEALFTIQVPALLSAELFGDLKAGWQWVEAMVIDEFLSVLIIVFGILAGFSREKHEDELIDKMRNDSLRWSLFINYGFLLLTLLGVYGMIYLSFMFAQLFLILFLFNIIFDIKLFRHYKSAGNEE
jgi:hypothetical protein